MLDTLLRFVLVAIYRLFCFAFLVYKRACFFWISLRLFKVECFISMMRIIYSVLVTRNSKTEMNLQNQFIGMFSMNLISLLIYCIVAIITACVHFTSAFFFTVVCFIGMCDGLIRRTAD